MSKGKAGRNGNGEKSLKNTSKSKDKGKGKRSASPPAQSQNKRPKLSQGTASGESSNTTCRESADQNRGPSANTSIPASKTPCTDSIPFHRLQAFENEALRVIPASVQPLLPEFERAITNRSIVLVTLVDRKHGAEGFPAGNLDAARDRLLKTLASESVQGLEHLNHLLAPLWANSRPRTASWIWPACQVSCVAMYETRHKALQVAKSLKPARCIFTRVPTRTSQLPSLFAWTEIPQEQVELLRQILVAFRKEEHQAASGFSSVRLPSAIAAESRSHSHSNSSVKVKVEGLGERAGSAISPTTGETPPPLLNRENQEAPGMLSESLQSAPPAVHHLMRPPPPDRVGNPTMDVTRLERMVEELALIPGSVEIWHIRDERLRNLCENVLAYPGAGHLADVLLSIVRCACQPIVERHGAGQPLDITWTVPPSDVSGVQSTQQTQGGDHQGRLLWDSPLPAPAYLRHAIQFIRVAMHPTLSVEETLFRLASACPELKARLEAMPEHALSKPDYFAHVAESAQVWLQKHNDQQQAKLNSTMEVTNAIAVRGEAAPQGPASTLPSSENRNAYKEVSLSIPVKGPHPSHMGVRDKTPATGQNACSAPQNPSASRLRSDPAWVPQTAFRLVPERLTRLQDLGVNEQLMQRRYRGICLDPESVVQCMNCEAMGHDRSDPTCPHRTCIHCGILDLHLPTQCPVRKLMLSLEQGDRNEPH